MASEPAKWWTKAELEASPSRRDGLDRETELNYHNAASQILVEVAARLRGASWTMYGAAWLFKSYFAQRSMARNDRWLVAAACMFLALKSYEQPKSLPTVAAVVEAVRWGRKAKQAPPGPGEPPTPASDPAHLAAFQESMKVAERAVLYATRFMLELPNPYKHLIDTFKRMTEDGAERGDLAAANLNAQLIMQAAWNIINDSVYTSLPVRYEPRKVALGAVFVGALVADVPVPLPPGKSFSAHFGVPQADLQDIINELMASYQRGSKVAHAKAARAVGQQAVAAGAQAGQEGSGAGGKTWQLAGDVGGVQLQVQGEGRVVAVNPQAAHSGCKQEREPRPDSGGGKRQQQQGGA